MIQPLTFEELFIDLENRNYTKEPLSNIIIKGFFIILVKEYISLLSKHLSIKILIQYTIQFKSIYKRKYNEKLKSIKEIQIALLILIFVYTIVHSNTIIESYTYYITKEIYPIILFLTLTFADDTFANIKNIKELYNPKIYTAKYIDIPFKENILNKPLFRNNRTMKSFEKIEILIYQTFNNSTKNPAQQTGFKDILTLHTTKYISVNILNLYHFHRKRQNTQINFVYNLNINYGSLLGLITKKFVDTIAKDPKLFVMTKQIEDIKTERCILKINNEIKRLYNIQRDMINKYTLKILFEQIIGIQFILLLKQSIINIIYGKEDNLLPRSDLIRNLQKIRITNIILSLFDINKSFFIIIKESNINKVSISNIIVDLSPITLDFLYNILKDFSNDTIKGSLLYLYPNYLYYTKPLISKQTLKVYMKTYNQGKLFCPKSNCKLYHYISSFKILKDFDIYIKYHFRKNQFTKESPAEIIDIYNKDLQKYIYF
ncbi:hypothetical protein EAF04_001370 [Stromatinia cepivora]|nr:hypothetical protein EAF04_001370 [Stromatinia cepivora]